MAVDPGARERDEGRRFPIYRAELAPSMREALAARLRASLPQEADGAVPLTARAFAVRGVAP